MNTHILPCLTLAAFLAPTMAPAESEWLQCGHAQAWLAAVAESPDYLKYAPSREIDILHLALEVTPDFKAGTVSGRATLRFMPIAQPFAELKLDGIDLTV